MQDHFSKSEFETGALNVIAAIANMIGLHYFALEKYHNELPDAPVLLNR